MIPASLLNPLSDTGGAAVTVNNPDASGMTGAGHTVVSNSATFNINEPANLPLNVVADQMNNEGVTPATITVTSPDPDANSFSATNLPPGLTISSTGVITGTIDPHGAGSYMVTVSALDDGTTGSITFTWTVNDVTAPTLANPGTQTNAAGAMITPVQLTFTDADTFTANGSLPPGLTVSNTGVISGTIAANAAPSYTVTITATDTGVATTAAVTFTWNISDSTPPMLSNPGPQSAARGSTITPLQLMYSDIDTFSDLVGANHTLPTGLTINNTGKISGTVDPSAANSYNVTITGKDGSTPISVTFTFTITGVPPPPPIGTKVPVDTVVLEVDGTLIEYVPGMSQPHIISPRGTIKAISTVVDTNGDGKTIVFAITTGLAGAQYDNTLWKFDPSFGWSEQSTGSFQQVSAATNSSGFAIEFGLLTNGALYEQSFTFGLNTGFTLLSPAGTIKYISAITDASTVDNVYAIVTQNNNLWQHTSTRGWQQLSTGSFQQVSAGLNSAGQADVYAVLTNSQLWEQNPAFGPIGLNSAWLQLSGFNNLPTSFSSVTAGGADKAFAITSSPDQTIWEHTPTSNSQLSTGLKAAQLSATQTPTGVDEVFATLIDGSFWEYSTALPGNHFLNLIAPGVVASSSTPP